MSIRKRNPLKENNSAAIKQFAASADEPKNGEAQQPGPAKVLDPKAPRNRRTQYPFNDYEDDMITRAAEASYCSKLAFMRRAIMEAAARKLEEDK